MSKKEKGIMNTGEVKGLTLERKMMMMFSLGGI